jgi:hypothetical protein
LFGCNFYFFTEIIPKEIPIIKATSTIIKTQKPTSPEESNNNNSIYEDILQKKAENINNYQAVKAIDTAKQPSPIDENNQKSSKITNEISEKILKTDLENDDKLISLLKSEVKRLESTKGVKS